MKSHFEMVVFDIIGTTVASQNEVIECLSKAARKHKIDISETQLQTYLDWAEIDIFRMLFSNKLGKEHPQIEVRGQKAFRYYQKELENWYLNNPVYPAPGVLEVFSFLKKKKIKICLTSDLKRTTTDIILKKLGWDKGLNLKKIGGKDSIINLSVTADEVDFGRPRPDMILKAMKMLGIENPKMVIKIGDTSSDLTAGKMANCLFSIGINSAYHSKEHLAAYYNNGLIESMEDFLPFIKKKIDNSQLIKSKKSFAPTIF